MFGVTKDSWTRWISADFCLFSSRPEDILGSVEVDGKGEIIGNFQASGTYRIITNQGM